MTASANYRIKKDLEERKKYVYRKRCKMTQKEAMKKTSRQCQDE